jgi:hypothetical protein
VTSPPGEPKASVPPACQKSQRLSRLGQRREIKKIAKSKLAEHDLPFSTWSLAKLAEFLVAEGVVDDISHEGLRVALYWASVSNPASPFVDMVSGARGTAAN